MRLNSGYYTGWTSGSYDPAAFTGGSANAAATGDRIAATNIARPPATGGRRPTH